MRGPHRRFTWRLHGDSHGTAIHAGILPSGGVVDIDDRLTRFTNPRFVHAPEQRSVTSDVDAVDDGGSGRWCQLAAMSNY
jgi:hypothetical protein